MRVGLSIVALAGFLAVAQIMRVGPTEPADVSVWGPQFELLQGTSVVLLMEASQANACNKFLDDLRSYIRGPRSGEMGANLTLHVLPVLDEGLDHPSYFEEYFARRRLPASVKSVYRHQLGVDVPEVELPAAFLLHDGAVLWHETIAVDMDFEPMVRAFRQVVGS